MYSGSEFIGLLIGLRLRKFDSPEVSSTAAVSPIALAMPSIAAVASPARAVGSTIIQTVRQRDVPSARLASRRPPGTIRNCTSVVLAMIGTIVTASAHA